MYPSDISLVHSRYFYLSDGTNVFEIPQLIVQLLGTDTRSGYMGQLRLDQVDDDAISIVCEKMVYLSLSFSLLLSRVGIFAFGSPCAQRSLFLLSEQRLLQ